MPSCLNHNICMCACMFACRYVGWLQLHFMFFSFRIAAVVVGIVIFCELIAFICSCFCECPILNDISCCHWYCIFFIHYLIIYAHLFYILFIIYYYISLYRLDHRLYIYIFLDLIKGRGLLRTWPFFLFFFNDLFSTKIPLKAAVDQKNMCLICCLHLPHRPPLPLRSPPLPIISRNSLHLWHLKSARAGEFVFRGRLIF